MEFLDLTLPFPIHECWFRIINQDLITFDSVLAKEDVETKVIRFYRLLGRSYDDLIGKKAKVLDRLNKYHLMSKENFWGKCIDLSSDKIPDIAEEIRAELKYNIETFYSNYVYRYKYWEYEACNDFYPKYRESSNFNELWEEDFTITPEEIENFLFTTTKMYLDMAAQHEREQDEYNEQLRRNEYNEQLRAERKKIYYKK